MPEGAGRHVRGQPRRGPGRRGMGASVVRRPPARRRCPSTTPTWSSRSAVALHGIHRAGVVGGMRVLVLGAGPIGLCTVAAARHLGADVDLEGRRPHPDRRRPSASGRRATVGADYDVVLDAAGTQARSTGPPSWPGRAARSGSSGPTGSPVALGPGLPDEGAHARSRRSPTATTTGWASSPRRPGSSAAVPELRGRAGHPPVRPGRRRRGVPGGRRPRRGPDQGRRPPLGPARRRASRPGATSWCGPEVPDGPGPCRGPVLASGSMGTERAESGHLVPTPAGGVGTRTVRSRARPGRSGRRRRPGRRQPRRAASPSGQQTRQRAGRGAGRSRRRRRPAPTARRWRTGPACPVRLVSTTSGRRPGPCWWPAVALQCRAPPSRPVRHPAAGSAAPADPRTVPPAAALLRGVTPVYRVASSRPGTAGRRWPRLLAEDRAGTAPASWPRTLGARGRRARGPSAGALLDALEQATGWEAWRSLRDVRGTHAGGRRAGHGLHRRRLLA